jgi:hypothetical protein
MHISKAAFDDPYFRDMCQAGGFQYQLTTGQLKLWVRAEWSVFQLFLSFLLNHKVKEAKGNASAQFLHDGGTLASHKKYQAFAMQFIGPEWVKNFVICYAFPRCKDSKDAPVAQLAELSFASNTGFQFYDMFATAIQDRAAVGVARQLTLEEEVCAMHDGDKLGQSASGALVRSKNSKEFNPFPEGILVLSNARACATNFTHGGRYEALFKTSSSATRTCPNNFVGPR